jgi:hypothetical protein
MQIKKAFAAGALGLLMAGSTVAFAATLGDYPKPFVSTAGSADFLVVVGASAAPSDVVGAVDVAARLGGVGTSYTCTGSSAATGVTGGVALDTANTKIRVGDNLAAAKDTLTKDDLTILASGSVTDTSGTEYKYDQYIAVGSTATLGYDYKSTAGITDALIDISSTSSSVNAQLYTAKIVFQKDLPMNVTGSATSTVIDGKAIKLFGQDYTFGSGSSEISFTSTKLVTLYGGGQEVTLNWDGTTAATQTVTVGSKTLSISLTGITTGDKASLNIDGTTDTYTAGQYVTSSGVRIFVKSVNRFGQGNTGQVVLKVGADKIKLQDAQAVKTGSDEDTVKGTYVSLTGDTSTGKISQILVYVYKSGDSGTDYVQAGSAFTDPVFKSFKLAFNGYSPTLDASTRDSIAVSTSGDNAATVTFTDFRGYAKSLTFGYNYIGSGSQTYAGLMDNNQYTISTLEGDWLGLNNYTIIDQGGFSHLLQVTNFDTASTTKKVTLRDVISNTDYEVILSDRAGFEGTKIIDGKTYYVNVSKEAQSGYPGNQTVKILRETLGTDASRSAGSSSYPYQVYTPLKLKNGEELVFVKPTTLTNGTYYQVPGNHTVTNGEGLCTIRPTSHGALVTANTTTYTCGSISYTFFFVTNLSTSGTFYPTSMNLTGNTNSAGLIVLEEKDNANIRGAVQVPVDTYASGSTNKIRVGGQSIATMLVSTSEHDRQTTTNYVTKGIDYYGTFITRNSQDQGTVTITYPDDQIVGQVAFGPSPVFTSTGATAGSTVTQAVPIRTAVGKLDSEITSAEKTTKNLILVGGPAVNTLVADLATATKTKDVAWYRTQGAGTAIIDLVSDAFTTGKVALVVAGYGADDTRAAAKILQDYETYSSQLAAKASVTIKNGVISTTAA